MRARAALVALVLAAGCAPSFQLTLPDRFVTLPDDPSVERGAYALRATTPDGVVVAVQAVDHREDGSVAFWSEAITRRLRDQQGYALLSEEDVTSARGDPGRLLRFGRDLEGHAYRYTLVVYVTDSHLVVAEAGGREATYAELESEIESALGAMRW